MTHSTFANFALAEPLARALNDRGYATPTPVQAQALPPQLEGRDLLALAETGSGKTAAFVLPILNEIATHNIDPGHKQVLSLILAPTRELALQIDAEVAALARHLNVRRAVVLGGVGKGPQISALRRGVHVLVATPGRLLDLVGERFTDLSGVRTLVLDEADRMFDMGFIRDIRKIVGMLPQKRRTALLSATMPDEVRKLTHDILREPVRVDLSPKQLVVDRIDQKVMIVRATEKQSRLHTLLKDESWSRVIVFTRTKRGADRVADRLGMAGINASAIHGNKAQNARQRALADFTAGHVRVMVATDIAARGIDVSNITHVVNFDMPTEPETYVHRIGRTARKGTTGIAVSLCDPSERPEITAIERLMKQRIEVIDDVGGDVLPALDKRRTRDSDGDRDARHGRNGGGRSPRGRSEGRDDRSRGDRDRSEHSRDHGRGERRHANGERHEHARGEGRPHRAHGEASAQPKNGEGARAHNQGQRARARTGDGHGAAVHREREPHARARHTHSAHGERAEHGHGNARHAPRRDRASDSHGEGHSRRAHADAAPRAEHAPRSHAPSAHAPKAHASKPHAHGGHGHSGRSDRSHSGRPGSDAHKGHRGERHERPANAGSGFGGQQPPKFLKQRGR